jgi:hypothetical protein
MRRREWISEGGERGEDRDGRRGRRVFVGMGWSRHGAGDGAYIRICIMKALYLKMGILL